MFQGLENLGEIGTGRFCEEFLQSFVMHVKNADLGGDSGSNEAEG